jgi:hypothetical protein
MMPSEKVLRRAAERLVAALIAENILAAREHGSAVESRVYDALRKNFQEEEAIEREADRVLEANKRQSVGMDQRTLFLKIKEKIARDRGFVL